MKYMYYNTKKGMDSKNLCYNGIMLKRKVISLSLVFAVVLSQIGFLASVYADSTNTTFQVNVKESLTVSITSPTSAATGNIDEFLRNKYTLDVTTNNANGFTASMYSVSTTNLTNTIANTQIIPTLSSSSTRGSFPANYWGYSLGTTETLNGKTYNETDAGNTSSNYHPLVSTSATPITVLTSSNSGSGTRDIYFGAKANASKASGTYAGIVVISVVTDVIDNDNPITPVNPVGPSPDEEEPKYYPTPSGGSPNGATTYTYRRTNPSTGTTTTTTQISDGDNRDSYNGYTPPQGVIENTTSDINDGSSLAAGLATTATVAAASGMFFFILAKRREDDEDEEEEAQL